MGRELLINLSYAEQRSGFTWSEDVKAHCLGMHLEGKAKTYFQSRSTSWWTECPTLWYLLDRLGGAFNSNMTMGKANKIFLGKKDPSKSWIDHYLCLLAVNDQVDGGFEYLVLENIVHHEAPEFRLVLMAKRDTNRVDYLKHAEELVHYACLIDTVSKPQTVKFVNQKEGTKGKKYFVCGKKGHIAKKCYAKKNGNKSEDDENSSSAPLVMYLDKEKDEMDNFQDESMVQWILDSGSCKHIVNDISLLWDIKTASEVVTLANQELWYLTQWGLLKLRCPMERTGKKQRSETFIIMENWQKYPIIRYPGR